MLRQSRYFTIPRSGVAATVAGHRKILAAVRRRDPEKARRAMCEHLDEAASVLKGQGECPISHES
jgi:DNA-binding FadR family transcriptional regulator